MQSCNGVRIERMKIVVRRKSIINAELLGYDVGVFLLSKKRKSIVRYWINSAEEVICNLSGYNIVRY